jgi:hypothetical protein
MMLGQLVYGIRLHSIYLSRCAARTAISEDIICQSALQVNALHMHACRRNFSLCSNLHQSRNSISQNAPMKQSTVTNESCHSVQAVTTPPPPSICCGCQKPHWQALTNTHGQGNCS